MDYTPAEYSKAIRRKMCRLPQEVQKELKRVYEKTWLIVELHGDGLVIPAKDSLNRLKDLFDVVLNELKNQKYRR